MCRTHNFVDFGFSESLNHYPTGNKLVFSHFSPLFPIDFSSIPFVELADRFNSCNFYFSKLIKLKSICAWKAREIRLKFTLICLTYQLIIEQINFVPCKVERPFRQPTNIQKISEIRWKDKTNEKTTIIRSLKYLKYRRHRFNLNYLLKSSPVLVNCVCEKE